MFAKLIEEAGGPEPFAQELFREIRQAGDVDSWKVIKQLGSGGGAAAAAAKILAELQSQHDREHPLLAGLWALGRFGHGAADGLKDTVLNTARFAGDLVLGPAGTQARQLFGPLPEWVPESGRTVDPLIEKGRDILNYAGQVGAGQRNPIEDVTGEVADAMRGLRRGATEVAETLVDGGPAALANRYADGAGNIASEVATAYFMPGVARAAGLKRAYSYQDQVAHWRNRGYNPERAQRLAELYDGEGHHFLPKWLGYGVLGLPKFIMESQFNVLKPANISRGDFYVLHGKVDKRAGGGPIMGRGKGSGWNRGSIGTELAGPVGRLYYGSPAELKALVTMPIVGDEEAYPLDPTDAGPANEVDVMRGWRDEEDLPINP